MVVSKLGISGFPGGPPFSVRFLAPKMAVPGHATMLVAVLQLYVRMVLMRIMHLVFAEVLGCGRSASFVFFIPKNVCLAGGFKPIASMYGIFTYIYHKN